MGNLDPTPASYGWNIDLTPPDIFIDSTPPDPSTASNATFTFHSDDVTATFECAMDDPANFSTCTSPGYYDALSNGEHTFYVRSKDPAGNYSTQASYSWHIRLEGGWVATSTTNAPSARWGHTVVWDGHEMIILGRLV